MYLRANTDILVLTDILYVLSYRAGMITPTLETHSMLIDGVRYDQLHIAHIKSTANNTLISITDYQGKNQLHMAHIKSTANNTLISITDYQGKNQSYRTHKIYCE